MSVKIEDRLEVQGRAESGAWTEIRIGGSSCEILVCSSRSKVFQDSLRAQQRIFMKKNNKKRFQDLDDTIASECIFTAMFGTLVKDWRGLEKDDKSFEFNKENFLWACSNLWEFAEAVMAISTTHELWESSFVEEVEKN